MSVQKKKQNWTVEIIVVLICLFLLSAIGAYFGSNSYSKAYLKIVSLPAVLVNGHSIPLSDFYKRVDIAGKLSQAPSQDEVLSKIIIQKKSELVAMQHGITVTDQELQDAQKAEGASESILSSLGIDMNYYAQNILKPELLQNRLAVWLAQQKDQNPDAFAKFSDAQKDLDAGDAFESAANKYSDDTLNAKAGGDLGFVGTRDVFPEIYQELAQIKDHNTHVVYSRLGIHLVQVLDTDNNGPDGSARFHVRQIFIKTQDFNTWLNKQNFTVFKFI